MQRREAALADGKTSAAAHDHSNFVRRIIPLLTRRKTAFSARVARPASLMLGYTPYSLQPPHRRRKADHAQPSRVEQEPASTPVTASKPSRKMGVPT